jgi:hypothetical protein
MLVMIGGTKPDFITQGVMNLRERVMVSCHFFTVMMSGQCFRNLLGEAVSPQVLVHGDGDHERASDRLVRVYGVGGDHGGKTGDLDSSAGVSDDDDDFPSPFVLVAECGDEVAKHHDQNVGDWRGGLSANAALSVDTDWRSRLTHSRQPHLRLPNSSILPRRPRTDPITQRSRRAEPNESANENSKVHEPNTLAVKVIRRRSEILTLRQIDSQERAARPGNDKGREFDDREGEQLPRNPEVESNGFEGVCVWLEDPPLLLAGGAFAEVGVAFGCGLFAEVGHCDARRDVGDLAAQLFGITVRSACVADVFAGVGR